MKTAKIRPTGRKALRRKRQSTRQPHLANTPKTPQLGQPHEAWRSKALATLAKQARGLKWSRSLFLLLLDELYVGDEFDALVGRPEKVPVTRYPEAIAVAIALRHSWRLDDLHEVADRLIGVSPRPAARRKSGTE